VTTLWLSASYSRLYRIPAQLLLRCNAYMATKLQRDSASGFRRKLPQTRSDAVMLNPCNRKLSKPQHKNPLERTSSTVLTSTEHTSNMSRSPYPQYVGNRSALLARVMGSICRRCTDEAQCSGERGVADLPGPQSHAKLYWTRPRCSDMPALSARGGSRAATHTWRFVPCYGRRNGRNTHRRTDD
jgi:hypothetical protein